MDEQTSTWWQRQDMQGARALVLSSLAFSLMTVCVKQLGGRIPVSEIVLVRSVVSIALTGTAMALGGVSPLGNNRRLLLLRGICGSVALLCFFEAITALPLASATVLQYTYPTFTAAAAWLLLGERLRRRIGLAVLLGWIGVVFVIQPEWLGAGQNEIYLRIRSDAPIAFSAALASRGAYEWFSSTRNFVSGMVYGVIIMLMYNALVYLLVRERLFLAYSYALAALLFVHLTTSGVGYLYLWPSLPPELNTDLLRMSIGLALAAVAWTARAYLKVWTWSRCLDLQVNLVTYRTWLKDQTGLVRENVGDEIHVLRKNLIEVESRGVELEATYAPNPQLRIDLILAHGKAHHTQNQAPDLENPGTFVDQSDRRGHRRTARP